jgi:flagellar protein FliO/FliZ
VLLAAPKAHAAAKTHAVVIHRDTTPLPAAVSHPASVGTHHVAASSGVFLRTGIGLVVVVALIYGIYWLLKRYAGSKGGGRSDGRMQVIATTALAPNRALHLVSVGDELVLVGSAEHAVTPIRIYSDDEAGEIRARLEGGPAPLRPASGFGGGFSGFVTELRARTVRK